MQASSSFDKKPSNSSPFFTVPIFGFPKSLLTVSRNCPIDNGMPMEERMVAKAFKSFIKENDLPEVVFHSLRHLSTSLKLVASNGDIKAVQGDTGHAQARMVTEVYAHTFDGNRREIANKLDHLFFSPSADGKGKEKTDLKEKLLLAVTKRPELLQVLTALTEE